LPVTPARRTAWNFLLLTAATVAFILYGSFYPFDFHSRAGSPVDALLATFRLGTSRGDLLSNILLYLPLGFFGAHVLVRRRLWHALPVAALSTALSVFVELVQYYDVSRATRLVDVYANAAGAFIGASTAVVLSLTRLSLLDVAVSRNRYVLTMVACWLAARLFPYVPSIDLAKYKHALKPLIFSPALPLIPLWGHFAMGLAISALIGELLGIAKSRLAAPACLLGVICIRVSLAGVTLSPPEVVGSLGAAVCWTFVISYLRWRMALIAVLLASSIALQSLQPFTFLAAPRPFGWIPFRGFLAGSLTTNLVSFVEKAALYGSLVWLVVRTGRGVFLSTAVSAAFVLVLRFCQVFLPARSAEITDAIMVLMLGALMALLNDGRRPQTARVSSDAAART
jgi:VanZ family protein